MTPVPDRAKAIEAMARGMYESMRANRRRDWEAASPTMQDGYRDEARAALAALEAEGWDLTDTREAKHSVQRDVEDFHRVVVGIPDSTTPAIRRPELRAELIREEAKETVDAILHGDLVEAIDGMCDVLAVIYGTAAEFGINLAPFWDEVHRTNMAKAGGPVREDGKRLKPPGWTRPDIAGVLALSSVPVEEEGKHDG